mgnify:CR=1 FL=1
MRSYSQLNWARVVETLDVVRAIAERYAYHPAIIGVEPLNEPWMTTPIGPLKRFYWERCGAQRRRRAARATARPTRRTRAHAAHDLQL